jgi:hypothetical protein
MPGITCPECGKPIKDAAADVCPHCNVELAAAPPPAPVRKPDDTQKYMILVGSLVGIVLLVLLASSFMKGTADCRDCKAKGYITCDNCKTGKAKCLFCKGTGNDPQTFSTCPQCNGSGTAPVCPRCQGRTKITCPACGGTGKRPA